MQQYVRLQEGCRTSRRTVADAIEVVRQVLGLNEIPRGQFEIGPLQLPSSKWTALVNVAFPDLSCIVSLPTAARFMARKGLSSQQTELEISQLDHAEVCSDGSVLLLSGTRLHAVEVVPTHLPYDPSKLEERILRHLISLTSAESDCYRSIRKGLPEHLQYQVPDYRKLDFSSVRKIQAPLLKLIRGHIEDNDPELKVSNQKIADALATFGIRVPKRRLRIR